ncbi:class I SAM-dependent rRNA methyltransferase [Nannocystaceae bacterium ST9]
MSKPRTSAPAQSKPGVVRLSKPLERAIGQGHPWIYRDALTGTLPEPGRVVTVFDRQGRFLARGLAEAGPIGVRVFTTRDEPLDAALIGERIAGALALRERLAPAETDALRLLHGEGDRLPGVVCDRYADFAVLRYDGSAAPAIAATVERELGERLRALGVRTLLRRSGRGEDKRVEPIWGEAPREVVEIRECGMRLLVDLVRGQKTGMFLDLRAARRRVRELVAGLVASSKGGELRVANLFGYTGGFSIAAGLAGASMVTTVDVAAPALELASRAWLANGLAPAHHHAAASEVATWLASSERASFDLVVADPPSFAPNAESRERGLAAYRALHAAALPSVRIGGFYLAATCSSHVDRPAFEDTLRKAARAQRVELQVVERGSADFDHPVPLGFAEGEYLVWTLARVLA